MQRKLFEVWQNFLSDAVESKFFITLFTRDHSTSFACIHNELAFIFFLSTLSRFRNEVGALTISAT